MQHGLFTTKYLDFITFNTVLIIVAKSNSTRLEGESLDLALKLKSNINSQRTDYSDTPTPTTVDPFWILGFFEGEGTVGLKCGVPFVQLGQHKRSVAVLHAVQNTLLTTVFASCPTPPVFSLSFNARTSVYTLSLTSVGTQYDYLLPYILSVQFISRKAIDLAFWGIVLHMYKTGIAYIPSGRGLIQAIAAYINDGRYSNAPVVMPVPSQLDAIAVIHQPVSVVRTQDISQQIFAALVGKHLQREVYVYVDGVLHSKHSTFAAAQSAVGISVISRAASRNLDTGRLYKGRYEFTSSLKPSRGPNTRLEHCISQKKYLIIYFFILNNIFFGRLGLIHVS